MFYQDNKATVVRYLKLARPLSPEGSRVGQRRGRLGRMMHLIATLIKSTIARERPLGSVLSRVEIRLELCDQTHLPDSTESLGYTRHAQNEVCAGDFRERAQSHN